MLYIEIAETPYALSEGLMHRETLAANAGMLFRFRRPQVLKFWGLNTYLPLDIAFVSTEGKIASIKKIEPFSKSSVSSDTECVLAIEANEGYFAKHSIGFGSSIDIGKDDLGFDVVMFKNKEEKIGS